MIGNLERPVGQQIRQVLDTVGKRRMYVLMAAFFLLSTFFLSQAVLFDAAVPFFLPVWALAHAAIQKTSYICIHRRDCGRGFSGAGTSSHPFIATAVVQCGEQVSSYAEVDSIDGCGDDRCRTGSLAVCHA